LKIYISQGSVATQLRSHVIFDNQVIANDVWSNRNATQASSSTDIRLTL